MSLSKVQVISLLVAGAAALLTAMATDGQEVVVGNPPSLESGQGGGQDRNVPRNGGQGGNVPDGGGHAGNLPDYTTGRAQATPLPDRPGSSNTDYSSFSEFFESPWFAFVTGLASILGLLVPLYVTQVRAIPFSLYRSLVWRKSLLLAGGVGLGVFSAVQILASERLFSGMMHSIYLMSNRERVPFFASDVYVLLIVWTAMLVAGAVLVVVGVRYDPIAYARAVILREQEVLGKARAKQVSAILEGRKVENLPLPDRRELREVMEFYRYVQWRYADVVLGAPPPTFPIGREEGALNIMNEDT